MFEAMVATESTNEKFARVVGPHAGARDAASPETPETFSIVKCLEISTAHLTEASCNALTEHAKGGSGCLPATATYRWGLFMQVPDELDDADDPDEADERAVQYPDVEAVIGFARMLGVGWVRFDADGLTVEQLPAYDW